MVTQQDSTEEHKVGLLGAPLTKVLSAATAVHHRWPAVSPKPHVDGDGRQRGWLAGTEGRGKGPAAAHGSFPKIQASGVPDGEGEGGDRRLLGLTASLATDPRMPAFWPLDQVATFMYGSQAGGRVGAVVRQ